MCCIGRAVEKGRKFQTFFEEEIAKSSYDQYSPGHNFVVKLNNKNIPYEHHTCQVVGAEEPMQPCNKSLLINVGLLCQKN